MERFGYNSQMPRIRSVGELWSLGIFSQSTPRNNRFESTDDENNGIQGDVVEQVTEHCCSVDSHEKAFHLQSFCDKLFISHTLSFHQAFGNI